MDFGFGPGPKFCRGQAGCMMGEFAGLHNGMWVLLVDNVTKDNLQNITLAQIDTLRQQKMQELDNMTLAEIHDLKMKKWQEMQNMTLAEIKEQRQQMGGRDGPFVEPFIGPFMEPLRGAGYGFQNDPALMSDEQTSDSQ
jgi:hypothetical protein